MFIAFAVVSALFAALLVARVGGAYRAELLRRWPVLVLGLGALLSLWRGAIGPAIALATIAGMVWMATPARRGPPGGAPDPKDREARALLGLDANATDNEIRAAYRAKMAHAHPDRGGSHTEAARLGAARDRLLTKR